MVDITKLPKAKSGFEELRSQNQIYVDHTDLIYEFAYLDGPNFLSRPRRFGKSLLISTLESLFSHGTEFFKGLKIEKLWEKRDSRVEIKSDLPKRRGLERKFGPSK